MATLLEGVNNKFYEVNFKNLIFYIYGCFCVYKLEIMSITVQWSVYVGNSFCGCKKKVWFSVGLSLNVSLLSRLRKNCTLFHYPTKTVSFSRPTENRASGSYAIRNAFLCPSTVLFVVAHSCYNFKCLDIEGPKNLSA